MGTCLTSCFRCLCCCCCCCTESPSTENERNDSNKPLLSKNKVVPSQTESRPRSSDLPSDLSHKQWYHGEISNDEADHRLEEGANDNDGSYLVYNNPRVKGQYILLVYYRGDPLRWKIQKIPSDGMYILGEDGPEVARYRTVRELIKTHRGVMGRPIKLESGGMLTLSKSYVSKPSP